MKYGIDPNDRPEPQPDDRVRRVLAHARFIGLVLEPQLRRGECEWSRQWVARANDPDRARVLCLTSDTALGALELAARVLLDGAEPERSR